MFKIVYFHSNTKSIAFITFIMPYDNINDSVLFCETFDFLRALGQCFPLVHSMDNPMKMALPGEFSWTRAIEQIHPCNNFKFPSMP